MSKDDLKPCPFCRHGGKPELKSKMVYEHIREIQMPFYKVECQECLIGYDYDPSKDSAIRRWNWRAEAQAVDVEAIRNEALRTYHKEQWEVIKHGGKPLSPIEWAFDYLHSRNLIRGVNGDA